MSGHVWPDGGSLLDQPNILIEAFDTIRLAKHAVEKDRAD